MASVADLTFIGAPVDDVVATAQFIGGLLLTRRQKASVLRDFLEERGFILTDEIREAARDYLEFL